MNSESKGRLLTVDFWKTVKNSWDEKIGGVEGTAILCLRKIVIKNQGAPGVTLQHENAD